jgi:preprotein translocase subunit SecE
VKRAISTKKSHSRFKFLGEVIAELKKVVWPTRQETMRLTILVLIVCIAVGLLLGAIDYGFSKLVSEIFLGG